MKDDINQGIPKTYFDIDNETKASGFTMASDIQTCSLLKTLATSMSSEIKVDDDGQLMFRGARKGDMIYMVDGIKANDVVNIPSSAIGNMMVYTGALPAKYGDTLGGVVVVETKSYFDLYRAWMAGR